jgi:hypothetical protein
MLENTVLWRRDYRPDELDPEYIKPEVCNYNVYWKIAAVRYMIVLDTIYSDFAQFLFFSGKDFLIFFFY